MHDEDLERRIAAARADLGTALNPAAPDLRMVAHRPRVRWMAIGGAVAAIVIAVASFAVVTRDGDDSPDVVAGPGQGGANADLLAPGTSRPLARSPLAGRSTMAAVWTGSEMLIWGGDGLNGQLGDGAAYDPRADSWQLLPDAPLSARNAPAAVWTGHEMLLWGGTSGDGSHSDGAVYNPTSKTWRTIAAAPFESSGRPIAVWTGTEMVVLAGFNSSDAAAYDPVADQWRRLADLPGHLQAPNPVAAWTGSRVFTVVQAAGRTPLDSAPRVISLDLGDNQWIDAPRVDEGQVVLTWMGDALVAAAGRQAVILDADGRSWTPIAEAPGSTRVGDTPAVWTGTQLLLWEVDSASVVDPTRRTWEPLAADFGHRTQPAAVWADGVFLSWGGFPDQATGIMLRPDSVASAGSPAATTIPPAPTAGSASRTDTVLVSGVPTVLATYIIATENEGTLGRIDVLEWRSAWRSATSFDIPAPGVLAQQENARPLLVRDVTGDGESDFVVPLEAAATAPYEVISNHSGSWQQVPFGSADRVIVTEPDAPAADRFVTSSNLCDPTCAQGRYRRELWRYSSLQRRFTLVNSAVCEGTAPGQWRCDPADSPLATGQPIGSSQ